jgi:hypothetical protein
MCEEGWHKKINKKKERVSWLIYLIQPPRLEGHARCQKIKPSLGFIDVMLTCRFHQEIKEVIGYNNSFENNCHFL